MLDSSIYPLMFYEIAGIALKPKPKVQDKDDHLLYLLEDGLAKYLQRVIESKYEDWSMIDLANIEHILISDCENFASQNPLVALRLSEAYLNKFETFVHNPIMTTLDVEDYYKITMNYSQFSNAIESKFGFHGKKIFDIDKFANFVDKLIKEQVEISDRQKEFLVECFVNYCKEIPKDDDQRMEKEWEILKEIMEKFPSLGIEYLKINTFGKSKQISNISNLKDITSVD